MTDGLDHEAAYRAHCRAWLEKHATPRTAGDRWGTGGYVVDRESYERGREWQRVLHAAGFAGIAWPAEYGGAGGTEWMARVFAEESADYEESSGFLGATMSTLVPTLLEHGTVEQRRRFVPAAISAEITFCQLFSEPGAGSDLASLATRAVPDGDAFIVNGQKVWSSAARFSDWGFLLARTDPDVPKHQGITFFLVDLASPGVEIRPLVQANGAADFDEVFFSDVRVPAVNVVGEIDGGWSPARTILTNESAFIGRIESDAFANLSVLAADHGLTADATVRQALADIYTRELVLDLAGEAIQVAIRERRPPPIDGALVKLLVAELKVRSGDLAARLCGAATMAGEGPTAAWARAEILGRYNYSIGGGTNEVHRNNLAERALGLPREPRADRDRPWRKTV